MSGSNARISCGVGPTTYRGQIQLLRLYRNTSDVPLYRWGINIFSANWKYFINKISYVNDRFKNDIFYLIFCCKCMQLCILKWLTIKPHNIDSVDARRTTLEEAIARSPRSASVQTILPDFLRDEAPLTEHFSGQRWVPKKTY